MTIQVFLKRKNRFLIGRYSDLEVLQGACARQEIHQKHIKMAAKSTSPGL